ncbi:hypothetical protein [Streptomyces sp. NBC_01314]|uniref:hypothetical protein n=1 Tax=Streptomyces sp. NBC_01314 TaxID=2903821 RepID=UPI00308E087B|nr:hypothetical protein OG622_45010 [Streptomyces sp. NBC_01314]
MLSTTSQHRPVRAAVNILLAVLMAFGVSTAIAPSAQAAPQAECWTPTANGEGRGYTFWNDGYGYNLKSGPYSDGCWNVGWVGQEKLIYLHCWKKNSYGNVWWYVRVAGTNDYGWTSDNNFWGDSVDENGDGHISFYEC